MADPFAAALAAIHRSPLGSDAVYDPQDGLSSTIRLVRTSTTMDMEIGGTIVVASTTLLEIMRSAVATPLAGDRVIIGDEIFVLMGEPRLDVERVSWTCEARPD